MNTKNKLNHADEEKHYEATPKTAVASPDLMHNVLVSIWFLFIISIFGVGLWLMFNGQGIDYSQSYIYKTLPF